MMAGAVLCLKSELALGVFILLQLGAWDYIQDGDTVVQDMDRTQAFAKGLQAWARWVDANLLQTTTKVFFQGYSPSHRK